MADISIMLLSSNSLCLQTLAPRHQESQSNGSLHLGGLGQLGVQDLPGAGPGGDGGGGCHHLPQEAVHPRYRRETTPPPPPPTPHRPQTQSLSLC